MKGTLIITKRDLAFLSKIFKDCKDNEKILLQIEKIGNAFDWYLQGGQF